MIKKIFAVLLFAAAAACTAPTPVDEGAQETLSVVATTTILGDVVANVAGAHVDLVVLVPPGTDPHRFDPSPAQARAVADADLIFANGLGLDAFALQLVDQDQVDTSVISVSEGVQTIHLDSGEESGVDPHVWMDPNNVIIWVENIAGALAEADPEHAAEFDENAAAYIHSLIELDAWIRSEVEAIPVQDRLLVTDHDSLGYFAAAYDFNLVGFVVPGYSTLAQPSAREMAALIDTIRGRNVPAIFVDPSFNPALAESVAADAGVDVLPLYTGSLSAADGPASSYLDLMRTDVQTIVSGLNGE